METLNHLLDAPLAIHIINARRSVVQDSTAYETCTRDKQARRAARKAKRW
jgi:hypothetical protein